MFGIDDVLLGSIVAGGASLLGGVFGNKSSAKEAEKNRSFQEDMSNTSYQRAVADMKAAGINPMLSAKVGGASTPSGSQAEQRDVVTPAVQSAVAARTASAQLQNVEQQTRIGQEQERELRLKNDTFDTFLRKIEADTGASVSSARASEAQAGLTAKLAQEVDVRINERNATIDEKRMAIRRAEAEINAMDWSNEVKRKEIQLLRVRIAGGLTENEAKALDLSFEKAYGEKFREAGLKYERGRADESAVRGAKAERSFGRREDLGSFGGATLDNLRELLKAFHGSD